MPAYKQRQHAVRRRPCTSIQFVSHLATFYCITCFAVLIQPGWLELSWAIPLVSTFWAVFLIDLTLYGYVLFADTRYAEALPGMPDSYPDGESRRCDDCDTDVFHTRVKHCQTCGWCMEGFDHHCRYLNVCVGGRTYPAWYSFVVLLLALMSICAFATVHAMNEPERHSLNQEQPVLFFLFVGAAAFASHLTGLFLFALLAQHSYFCLAGITTLEYIKDQTPPFPSLPPPGWRQAVQQSECHSCRGMLGFTDATEIDEVLYCTICQGDLAKAGVGFWQCELCEACSVCPICHRAASSAATVTTYRANALKRRSQALLGVVDTRHGGGSCKNRTPSAQSRLSSFSGEQREMRAGRRSISAVVAAVEGHAGESATCVLPCCRRQETDSESSSEGEN